MLVNLFKSILLFPKHVQNVSSPTVFPILLSNGGGFSAVLHRERKNILGKTPAIVRVCVPITPHLLEP